MLIELDKSWIGPECVAAECGIDERHRWERATRRTRDPEEGGNRKQVRWVEAAKDCRCWHVGEVVRPCHPTSIEKVHDRSSDGPVAAWKRDSRRQRRDYLRSG